MNSARTSLTGGTKWKIKNLIVVGMIFVVLLVISAAAGYFAALR